jgi:hypothetical protein
MQLHAYGGAADTSSLAAALVDAGVTGTLYDDVNDPTGVALLTLSETPTRSSRSTARSSGRRRSPASCRSRS